jgi:hypothetical protein
MSSVVQAVTMDDLYASWFTPMTNIGASFDGAEMMTLRAPSAGTRSVSTNIGQNLQGSSLLR